MDEQGQEPGAGPALPAVVVPPAAELAEAAERTAVLADLRRYVADLDDEGEPGPGLIPRWAEACGLVGGVEGAHVRLEEAAWLLGQPLELWERAFSAFGGLGYDLAKANDLPVEFGVYSYKLFSTISVVLYSAGAVPTSLEGLYRVLQQGGMLAEPSEADWRSGVTAVLNELERLGAVERTTSTDPHQLSLIAQLAGHDSPDPTLVRSTPLALWAMNRVLRNEGASAPIVGELADAGLDVLCPRLAGSPPSVVEAEIRAWVGHRTPDTAANEAARLLRRTEYALERKFALLALAEAGASGTAACMEVRVDGGLPGAVAATWLAERGAMEFDALTQDEGTLGLTDHLSAMYQLGLLFQELSEQADPSVLIHVIAGADHPHRDLLLDVISAEHPDPAIADLARKAR